MGQQKLIVVSTGSEEATRTRIEPVLALWPGIDPAKRPCCFTLAQVKADPSLLDRGQMVWLIATGSPPNGQRDVIAACQDRYQPVVLTDDTPRAPGQALDHGVVAAPADASPEVIAAILRTLYSQLTVVSHLHAELAVARTHQGGMIHQIDKIDEELRLAAQLQREFLPDALPECENVAFGVLFRPAGYVSGDIYDLVQLDDEHVGFFLADAVGHGVPAALMTAYIKRSLQTRERDHTTDRTRILSPDETLTRLNRDIVDQQGGRIRTATAIYGIINIQSLHVQLARAGHPHPMLLDRQGNATLIQSDGPMLGVFEAENFERVDLDLSPGQRLLIYSDGFEMAFHEPTVKGATRATANRRYITELPDLAHGPVDEAILPLGAKLDIQAGSLHQNDDLTALLIGARPGAAASHPLPHSSAA